LPSLAAAVPRAGRAAAKAAEALGSNGKDGMQLSGKEAACAGLVVLAAVAGGCGDGGRQGGQMPTVTINGKTWRVEVATTADQRYLGLSGREDLADDAGMLFIYNEPHVLDFCMRDCLIPLDIAFIDAEMRVVQTWTMATELHKVGRLDATYRSYTSGVPAQYALEVAAGSLERAGVTVGSRVEFSADVPAAAKAEPGP